MIQQTSEPLRIEVRLWSAAKAAFDTFKKNPVIRYDPQGVCANVIATGATVLIERGVATETVRDEAILTVF